VFLLVLLALVPRLATLWWDAGLGTSHHPDERQVVFVSEHLAGWFSDPGFYAYGSLHFQAVRAASVLIGGSDAFHRLLMGGRLVSLGASLLALVVGWWLTRRVWGRRAGVVFLLLGALVPLDIQQAHFATVEAHHSLWIILALAAAFWVAVRGSRPAAVAAGVAVGCSLAVKVASLGLALPLALGVLLALRGRTWARVVELAAIALTSGLLAFWLAQPWALVGARPPLVLLGAGALAVVLARLAGAVPRGWQRAAPTAGAVLLVAAIGTLLGAALRPAPAGSSLAPGVAPVIGPVFNAAYLRGVGEQVAMVTGAADLPYVRVYHGTEPFLYPLRELGWWGLGPLLLGTALGGTAWALWVLARRWRRWLEGRWNEGMVLLALLVAWLVPMSLRLATLQVKYLRYWEPLVVPAAMVAAWALTRLPRRQRRLAVPLVVAGTVLWGVTWLWGFAAPHPHRAAGDWLQMMVEPRQTVAFEHWDETVPLTVGRSVELPSYELPDDDAKVRQWCEALASADWVVLTSNRVRRTVLANPERYPRTGRLYRLLLAGEAGFEPLARFDRAPRLFGIERNIQRADESFVNYDFPRVVVLRRVESVDVDALVQRTRRPLPYLEGMGATALEARFVAPLPRPPAVPGGVRQTFDVTVWLLLFAVLGAAAWGLLLPVVRSWPDAGLALGLVTGWLAPSWLLWLGSELGLWAVGPATATVIVLAVAGAGGIAVWRQRRLAARLWRRRRRGMGLVLLAAVVVGALFLLVRAINPAIYWGEKPMDFSFLNAFLRASSWPPGEPWMAGMPLHYYYFGEVLASFPILVSNVGAAVGYNLMAAAIPAMSAALLAAFALLVARRRRRWLAAGLLPLLVLLTGNLQWPWLGELLSRHRWFDAWWATSRVVPGFAIDEYPLWTALFADLHGHFIALPVLLASLLWGWHTVHQGRRWPVAAALCGVSAGILVATNPWDLFVLVATLAVATVAAAPRPARGLGRLAVAGVVSVLATLPFVVELVQGIGAGAGGRLLLLTRQDFAPAWAILRHFGVFLLPLVVLAVALLWGRGRLLAVVPVAVAAALLGLATLSSAAALALGAAVLFAAAAADRQERIQRMVWFLAMLAMLAVAACERFTVIDRMNTLFKIYNGVWVLLAAALGVLVLRSGGWRRRLLLFAWLPLEAVALVNLPLGVAQGWVQPRISSPRPTLDGQAYLASERPQTWFFVRALEGMARPGDVVAEAAKTAYAEYTRIAMHTGQPTVVGWPWHLQQRGQSPEEIEARYADLTVLYGGSDPLARRAVLDRYHVRWVVLGDLERSTYGLAAGDPLAGVPGVVAMVRRGGDILYQVRPMTRAASRITALPPGRSALPPGMTALGTVPVERTPVLRSLALDQGGATAVLRNGGLMALDSQGQPLSPPPSPPCPAVGVARRGGTTWLGCGDGRVFRLDGDGWSPLGRVAGLAGLAAGDRLWAWGADGLWRFDGSGKWRPVDPRPVTAAAAQGGLIAMANATGVWVSSGGAWRRTEADLEGVRALAWQGSTLWALTAGGVLRSGGGALPWRRPYPALAPPAALAGSGERLWLVLEDGTLVQQVAEGCGSPWQPPAGGGPLEEPRGLASSPGGWFAVADTRHHRVAWFTYRGACLDQFGREGKAAGEFREPSGLALAPDGTLAVADTWNGRIQLLRPDGTVAVIGEDLYGPRDLAWAPDATLLVADTGNRRLLEYRPPSWQRRELFRFGAPVVGLAWVGGMLAAATPAAGEVVLIDPAAWTEVRRLEVPGWSEGQQQEGYLVVGADGRLLASAPRPGEVWAIDPAGRLAPRRVRTGLPGVTAMAVLPGGEIVAAETAESRLVHFRLSE